MKTIILLSVFISLFFHFAFMRIRNKILIIQIGGRPGHLVLPWVEVNDGTVIESDAPSVYSLLESKLSCPTDFESFSLSAQCFIIRWVYTFSNSIRATWLLILWNSNKNVHKSTVIMFNTGKCVLNLDNILRQMSSGCDRT